MKAKLHRTLAASFVVIAATPGCKKTSGSGGTDPDNDGPGTSSVWGNDQTGKCFISFPEHCPKGASCNPPPPPEIDCPPDKRDATAPAPTVTRRPTGKDDYLRVRSHWWMNPNNSYNQNQATCTFVPEYFCAPPGKPISCTSQDANVTVKCAFLTESGVPYEGGVSIPPGHFKVDSFTWKDVNGVCHKIPPRECKMQGCDEDDGAVVPCP